MHLRIRSLEYSASICLCISRTQTWPRRFLGKSHLLRTESIRLQRITPSSQRTYFDLLSSRLLLSSKALEGAAFNSQEMRRARRKGMPNYLQAGDYAHLLVVRSRLFADDAGGGIA